MDSGGVDAIAAVQSRVAEIQARFDQLRGGAAIGRLGAPSTTPSSSPTDFASALASATTTSDGSLAAAPPSDAAIPPDGDMRSTAARTRFAYDVLTRIGAPATKENVRALVAWQAAEGTRAAFNPLATVRSSKQPGETSFNSVGVKNFPSYQAGLGTTVAALQNGLYGDVLAALQRGDSAQAVAEAVASSRWGTGQAILRALAATPT